MLVSAVGGGGGLVVGCAGEDDAGVLGGGVVGRGVDGRVVRVGVGDGDVDGDRVGGADMPA